MGVTQDKRVIKVGDTIMRASKISCVDLKIDSATKKLKVWMNGNETPFEFGDLDNIMSFCSQYKDYLKCIGCTCWEEVPNAD